MSFYNVLSNWALRMEEKRKAKADKTKDKPPKGGKPATAAFVYNQLHSLEGFICKLFEATGSILTQKINEASDSLFEKNVNMTGNFVDLLKEHIDEHAKVADRILGETMQHYAASVNDEIIHAHNDIVTSQRQFHNIQAGNFGKVFSAFDELARGIDQNETNAAMRYLELVQHMRDGRVEQIAMNEAFFNVLQAIYEKLDSRLETIEHSVTAKQRRTDRPSIDWLMDNAEELIRFAEGLNRLKNNDAPALMAKSEVIKSIRVFNPDAPMASVKQAVEQRLEQWAA